MNRRIIAPISVFTGIVGVVVLAACTPVFNPVVRFIHNWEGITPAQTAGCVLFTIAGFWAAYKLLHLTCNYFVPRIERDQAELSTEQGMPEGIRNP